MATRLKVCITALMLLSVISLTTSSSYNVTKDELDTSTQTNRKIQTKPLAVIAASCLSNCRTKAKQCKNSVYQDITEQVAGVPARLLTISASAAAKFELERLNVRYWHKAGAARLRDTTRVASRLLMLRFIASPSLTHRCAHPR
jgi:hypothetical protein